jgi:hypothetical protein
VFAITERLSQGKRFSSTAPGAGWVPILCRLPNPSGLNHPILDYRRSLKPNGIYVVLGGSWAQILQGMLVAPLLSRLGNKKMRWMMTNVNQKDLAFLKGLLETGEVVPVIDRSYPLGEVAEAIRYLVKGHAPGKSRHNCYNAKLALSSPDCV